MGTYCISFSSEFIICMSPECVGPWTSCRADPRSVLRGARPSFPRPSLLIARSFFSEFFIPRDSSIARSTYSTRRASICIEVSPNINQHLIKETTQSSSFITQKDLSPSTFNFKQSELAISLIFSKFLPKTLNCKL